MKNTFTPKKAKKTLLGSRFCRFIKTSGLGFSFFLLLFLTEAGAFAQAPNISYSSPQVYTALTTITPLKAVNTGGAVPVPKPVTVGIAINTPYGVAVDATGNVYVAAYGANQVKEIPAGGGPVITLGSGFSLPTGVAVDASGNVYVADYGNSAIKEIPVGGGPIITLGSGFNRPYGIALDAAGRIYVSDRADNLIKKMPAGGGTPVTIGSGFSQPTGIAVDAAGNIYVADSGTNTIRKIPAGGGSTMTLTSGNGNLGGVAVDTAGNVYFADTNNTVIREVAAGGGAMIAVGSGFYRPIGLALGAAGKVYVADPGTDEINLINPGNYSISPAIPAGLIFDSYTGIIKGTPTVASPATDYHVTTFNSSGSSSATVNIKVLPSNELSSLKISAGKLSPSFASKVTNYRAGEANAVTSIAVTPTALEAGATIQVNGTAVTSGTASPGLPLNVGDNIITVLVTAQDGVTHKTYTINAARYQAQPVVSYSSPQVDTVGVAISPLGPAARSGVGPFGFNNGAVTIGSGFISPRDVAIDAAGNVYVADGAVKELPAGGGSMITLASGLVATSIAVDASGNVYVLDYDNSDFSASIKEIPVGGGPVIALTSDLFRPDDAIASDAAGNIYVAQSRLDEVAKIPAGGGAPVAVGSGFHAPSGLAVDTFGNVYVADELNNKIKKILATDGSTVTLANGHGAPRAVAVDVLGNVYFTEYSKSEIYEIPIDGGPQFTIASGFKYPGRFAIDPTGKIDVADVSSVKQIAPTGGYFISAALPAGLSFDQNTGIFSGTPTAVSPATNYTITAYNGGGSGSATVNIKTVAKGVKLTSLVVAGTALSPKFAGDTINYVASVPLSTTSTTVTPTTAEAGATITVNGVAVTSGTASPAIPLSAGDNTITTVVTAAGGAPQTTYTVVVTRAPLSNADLSNLRINDGPISPSFSAGTTDYTASVLYGITAVRVVPVTADSHATVTVNGSTVASGALSPAFPLMVGDNTISVIVRNGTTAKTYTITLTRLQSSNAFLTNLRLDYGRHALSPSFAYTTTNYTASVTNDVTSVNVIPAVFDPNATMTVNSVPVFSGAAAPVALSVGPNVINTVVTAHDGISTNTYTIIVTRAAPAGVSGNYASVSVAMPVEGVQFTNDNIVVRPGISPNGDGQNDFLVIEGISSYPDNKLMIINRSGQLVYEAKSYDNSQKVFDGRSSKNGAMQLPGTYFYSLDYTVKGVSKHKTGFIILKY